LIFFSSAAQTIGGSAAYNFLHLPPSAFLSASGGVNISYTNELGLAANNPALLNPQLHSQLQLNFNGFFGGIKAYSATGACYNKKFNTSFGSQIYFIDYGSIPQTDPSGNINGNFRPVDFVIQAGAARKYLENWSYGLNMKLIQSTYHIYHSTALAFDVGLLYSDTSAKFSASVLARNMGFQLASFAGVREDLPFDLQIGLTKRLARAPLGFSVTAQHAHRLNTTYNDEDFNTENNLQSNHSFFNKVLNHFIVASHIYIGNNLEATVGYNHLRRAELNIGASGNGLNGFSAGVRVKFQKLEALYSRASYQKNIAYNQIGITLKLNQFFGLAEP